MVVRTQAVVYARVTGGICMYSCWNVRCAILVNRSCRHSQTGQALRDNTSRAQRAMQML